MIYYIYSGPAFGYTLSGPRYLPIPKSSLTVQFPKTLVSSSSFTMTFQLNYIKKYIIIHLVNVEHACILALWNSTSLPTVRQWFCHIEDIEHMEDLTSSLKGTTSRFKKKGFTRWNSPTKQNTNNEWATRPNKHRGTRR